MNVGADVVRRKSEWMPLRQTPGARPQTPCSECLYVRRQPEVYGSSIELRMTRWWVEDDEWQLRLLVVVVADDGLPQPVMPDPDRASRWVDANAFALDVSPRFMDPQSSWGWRGGELRMMGLWNEEAEVVCWEWRSFKNDCGGRCECRTPPNRHARLRSGIHMSARECFYVRRQPEVYGSSIELRMTRWWVENDGVVEWGSRGSVLRVA